MTKVIKVILVLVLAVGIFGASQALAAGIVPCGQSEDDASTTIAENADCTLCHFFILINQIVNFVLFSLTAPLALLMLIIGGAMFMLAGGNPSTITQARKLISSVLIGIVIIYSAYFLIGVFLQAVGLNTWTTTIYQSWWGGFYEIDCEVDETTMAPTPTVPPIPPSPTPPTTTAFSPPINSGTVLTTIPLGTTFYSGANVITFP